MPGTNQEKPGTGVYIPAHVNALTSAGQAPDQAGPGASTNGGHLQRTASGQLHQHKGAVGRSRTFTAGPPPSRSSPDEPSSSCQQGEPRQHGHHHPPGCHRYHSFSYFRPREQQWDTTSMAAAQQLRHTSTGRGHMQPTNTPQVQPRLMAEGSPTISNSSRQGWGLDLPSCSSAGYSNACLPLSPTAAPPPGGYLPPGPGSSIASNNHGEAPRASWSSSGCSSGRSSIDARGGAVLASAYGSAFYNSSLQQPAVSAAGSAATPGRLLAVQSGEEPYYSCQSTDFDLIGAHSGMLAQQQLQPSSMFSAASLMSAGSLTADSSDLSLPMLLAPSNGGMLPLHLLQHQLQQHQQHHAPSTLDMEEQINRELLRLLCLRQQLTQNVPSAVAARATAATVAAARAAAATAAAASTGAGGVRSTIVRSSSDAAHCQPGMLPMAWGESPVWFDDSAARIHARAPASCAATAGAAGSSQALLQQVVGATAAAMRSHSGSLGIASAGGNSSSLSSCSTSNSTGTVSQAPVVGADSSPEQVVAAVQTKLQQLQMIQELQGELEDELLQLLPM